MTALALSNLPQTTLRLFARLSDHWTSFFAGIDDARAMALRYETLARLSDAELAARGLTRQDIPHAVLASFGRG